MAQQAIGIFVLAALPKGCACSCVNFDAGVFRQLRILRHFAPLVIGERAAQAHIKAFQDRAESFCCCRCSAIAEFHQRDVAGLVLDQRTDLRAVAGTLDVIVPLASLSPMAGYQTLGNVGRAQVDAGHVGNLPAPVNAA